MQFIDLKTQYNDLREDVNNRIQVVLDHGQYIMGPEIDELEKILASRTGTEHCITVASGTEALLISLMALEIGPGDEVITSPFSFAATTEVIALVGAKPVFVDIDLQDCNIDASLIEAAITDKTRAIMPVSLYGQAANMDAINEVAARFGNIPVIEDAAQSFGSTYKGRQSCSLSTIGCTSFFPSKPLGCYGDGGAIFTDDGALADLARQIRVHGQSKRYHHVVVGVGGRLDTLQAAVLLAKLAVFDAEIAARDRVAAQYNDMLANIENIVPVGVNPGSTSVWAQYTLRSRDREHLMTGLKSMDIPTAIHYPLPLHKQPAYAHNCRSVGSLSNAETAAQEVFSIPMHPYLQTKDQQQIVDAIAALQN